MDRRKIALVAFVCLLSLGGRAAGPDVTSERRPGFVANPTGKDYPASFFGIRSDGGTLYTRSIQFAIDYINQNGGGRLVFYVGRYLTGSLHLKSNVILQLEEGAVLVGSLNPMDHDRKQFTALIFAYDQHDVAITGKG